MARIIHVACLAGLALALAEPACGQGSPEEAVRARVKQFETAYNAGDAEQLAAIYAEDATHTYAFGGTHVGRAALAEGLRDQFAGPMKGTRLQEVGGGARGAVGNLEHVAGVGHRDGVKDPAGSD